MTQSPPDQRLAATPTLDFALQPTAVFSGTTASLTLVMSVPLSGPAVSFATTDGIFVALPVQGGSNTPLVTTLTGVTPKTPVKPWTAAPPAGGKIVIRTQNPITLQPGDSVSFEFDSLPIVTVTSPTNPSVSVTTSIGGKTSQTPVPVTVQLATPGIIAWANPPVIGLNSRAKLQWSTIGGTIVRAIGFSTNLVPSGYKDFSVDTPPNGTTVNPTVDIGSGGGSQHTYSVQLLSEPGDVQQGTTQNVTFTLHQPFIAQFGFLTGDRVVSAVTIPFLGTVTVTWNCKFVDPDQGVTLSYNQTASQNLPVYQMTVDPSIGLPVNTSTVKLVLRAPGYSGTQTAVITVTYEPIRILYFKYSVWTVSNGVDVLSNPVVATSPAVGYSISGNDQLSCLTVNGPGGPLIQHLGTGSEAYVEIRYFSPSAAVVANQPFTLQWFTHNATTLTLTTPDGDVAISSDQIAKGTSASFTLAAPFTFVLSAQAGGQNPVRSYLTVTPSGSS